MNDISFIEGKEIINYPHSYDWTILEQFGSEKISYTINHQFLDFVEPKNTQYIQEWISIFKKNGKSYIYAKGILKQAAIEERKLDILKKLEKRKKEGRNISKIPRKIPMSTVYGLFSKTYYNK